MDKLTYVTLLMFLINSPAAAGTIVDDETANNAIATAGIQIPRDANPSAHVGILGVSPGDADFVGIGPLVTGDVITTTTTPLADDFSTPDTMLAVFNAAGDRLAFSDDAIGLGSAIGFEVPADGEYFIGATGFGDFDFAGIHGEQGDYALTVSLVPVPSSNAPPDCEPASAAPVVLWPPNRQFVDIAVVGVTDPDGDPVSIAIDSIHQDEPGECGDGAGVGSDTASVRAAFDGAGDGRVYSIAFNASDGAGGACSGAVTVCVPHDQRAGGACVDQGPLFDSTDCDGN